MKISQNTLFLLHKAVQEASNALAIDLTINVESAFVEYYSEDYEGIYIQFKNEDKTGLFIAVKTDENNSFHSFLPKNDSGDASVGLIPHMYNSFDEDHAPDFISNDIAEIVISSLTAFWTLDLKERINSTLESQSLKILTEEL
jgi:hypothetical protein